MKNLLKDKVIIDNDKLTSRYTFMKNELPKGGKSELVFVDNPKHGVGKTQQDAYIMYLVTDSGKEVRFGTIPRLSVSKEMKSFMAESINEGKFDIILGGIEIPFSIKDMYQLASVYSFKDLSEEEKAMLIAKQYEEEGSFHTDFTIISNRFGELFAVELDSKAIESYIEDFEDNLVNGFDNSDLIDDFLIGISLNGEFYELDAKVIDSRYPFNIVDVESYNGKVLVGDRIDLQDYMLGEILSEDHMSLNTLFDELDLRYSDYVDMNALEELAERHIEYRFNEFVATGDIFNILEYEIEELMDENDIDIDMADVTWDDLEDIHDEIEDAYSEYFMASRGLEEFYDSVFEDANLKDIVDWEYVLEDEDMFDTIVNTITDSDVANDWRRTDLIAFYQPS